MTIRLLLADDHTMLREGLRRSMEGEGFDVMDVSMPVMDGIEATRLLKERLHDTQVVMLTMHADEDLIVKAVRAGASGYLVKDCTTDEVARTVRMAANGETAISTELAEAMLDQAQTLDYGHADEVISKREIEVLQLIAEGASTPEVGERLYISVKTVKNHLASIYQKLDSRDRTQAVVRAVKMGIIRLD
jgi:two-component system response regulator DegU